MESLLMLVHAWRPQLATLLLRTFIFDVFPDITITYIFLIHCATLFILSVRVQSECTPLQQAVEMVRDVSSMNNTIRKDM
jgi:hypothetical protein